MLLYFFRIKYLKVNKFKMATERKCGNCGEWNTVSVCTSCGSELDPKKIRVQKIRAVQEEKKLEPKLKMDIFFAKWKATRNPFLKLGYWIGYSIWTIYMGIISFILLFIAWGPG